MYRLEAVGITKIYEDTAIIADVHMAVKPGEVVSVLGPHGSGKTTLFNILAGVDRPDSGQVYLNGSDVTGKPGEVGCMRQDEMLLPFKTTLENVALSLIRRGMPSAEAEEKARFMLEQFGLHGTEHKYPDELSAQMRKKAELLRTWLCSDRAALLDEPFHTLKVTEKHNVCAWYMEVMDRLYLSTVFLSCDINEAILLSDRVYVLSGKPGRIVMEVEIQLPRPRSYKLLYEDRFQEYDRRIRSVLR